MQETSCAAPPRFFSSGRTSKPSFGGKFGRRSKCRSPRSSPLGSGLIGTSGRAIDMAIGMVRSTSR